MYENVMMKVSCCKTHRRTKLGVVAHAYVGKPRTAGSSQGQLSSHLVPSVNPNIYSIYELLDLEEGVRVAETDPEACH